MLITITIKPNIAGWMKIFRATASVKIRPLTANACSRYIRTYDGRIRSSAAQHNNGLELPTAELEFPEFTLQRASIHTDINHRADEHVAADAAEDVEIKRVH